MPELKLDLLESKARMHAAAVTHKRGRLSWQIFGLSR